MLDKILRPIRVAPFLLILLISVAACIPTAATPEPTPAISVEDAVAQTVAAQNAVDLQVQQTVDAALAAQGEGQGAAPGAGTQTGDAGSPDVADPNSGIQPIQPASDPNLASGTPQLRVIFSSANVRSGPGTNYRPVSALLKDSVVTAIAKNQNGSWFLIELPGGSKGWIADSVTDPVNAADMAKVQVAVTIPAPPPPTPTATATNTPVPTNTPTATSTIAAAHTATPTATATQPAPVPSPSEITVVNNSTIEVCFLFIDLSSDPWTDDRLGPNDTLLPGFQITFEFPSGEYDFMAQDCSGNIIADRFNEFILSPFTWDIR